MIVAVASGKGGTGKTTVSAALASIWDAPVTAVDLDVEEPNLHLFLRPHIVGMKKAFLQVPVVDESKCTKCGACSELCQFKAIAVMGPMVLTFPEMCHGCGGCKMVCPEGAISWTTRELGDVEWGRAGNAGFLMGKVMIGEAMSPPLMRQVKAWLPRVQTDDTDTGDVIVDAPPGVSCPAMAAVMDSDIVVLVTEPTPFGMYDFRLARAAFSPLGKPMGVVINRSGLGTDQVYALCSDNNLPILAEIPYTREIAEAYSKGRVISQISGEMNSLFVRLKSGIMELAGEATTHA